MITKGTKKICSETDLTEVNEHISTDNIKTFSDPRQILPTYSENTTLNSIIENMPDKSILVFSTGGTDRNYNIEEITNHQFNLVEIINSQKNRTRIKIYNCASASVDINEYTAIARYRDNTNEVINSPFSKTYTGLSSDRTLWEGTAARGSSITLSDSIFNYSYLLIQTGLGTAIWGNVLMCPIISEDQYLYAQKTWSNQSDALQLHTTTFQVISNKQINVLSSFYMNLPQHSIVQSEIKKIIGRI